MQNVPTIPTQFELTLARLAGQSAGAIIGRVLPYIDQCCLFMERYVELYSGEGGDRINLRFETGKEGDGRWRGPVGDYNCLWGVVEFLRGVAEEQWMGLD